MAAAFDFRPHSAGDCLGLTINVNYPFSRGGAFFDLMRTVRANKIRESVLLLCNLMVPVIEFPKESRRL